MGFGEDYNASTYSYRSFANELRNQRFSLSQIDGIIRQLEGWRREFDGLWASASKERNSAVAQSRLNETIIQVQGKIDKMLDLRNRLQNMVRETEAKIQQLEQSIGRLSDSLQHDRSRWLNLTKRRFRKRERNKRLITL